MAKGLAVSADADADVDTRESRAVPSLIIVAAICDGLFVLVCVRERGVDFFATVQYYSPDEFLACAALALVSYQTKLI